MPPAAAATAPLAAGSTILRAAVAYRDLVVKRFEQPYEIIVSQAPNHVAIAVNGDEPHSP